MTLWQSRLTTCDQPRAPGHVLAALSIVLLLISLGAPRALSQPAEKLPAAAAILDKYVEATGGKEAYAKLNNRLTNSTVEMVTQGIKGTLTIYAAKPDKLYSVAEVEGIGKIEKGTHGKVAWEINPILGPQIKEGDEKAILLRGAVFDGTVRWRKVFKKAECLAVETVNDKPCYKVILTPHEGSPETRYYDKQTNLLVKTELNLETPMGTIPVEAYPSEYKKVDGVLMPHHVKQVVLGMQETRVVTDSIEHNVKIPKDRFELPAEIRALIEKQKGDKPEPEKP